MSMEEQYRRNLDSSLRQVHEFTMGTEFSGGQLVNTMNALLRASFDTNFGVECSESLAVLYQTIGRVSPDMVTRCEDVPLLFFARSFAVVIEEAIRQLQQSRKVATVSLQYASSGAAEVWSSETPREEHIMQEEKYESDLCSTPPPTDSRSQQSSDSPLPPPLSSPLSLPSETRLDWRAHSPLAPSITSIKSPTATRAAPAAVGNAGLVGTEEWRRLVQRERPDKILDFSIESLKGRVNIFNVARGVREAEVRALLEPFGPIVEFYCHSPKGNKSGFALAKLEDDRARSEAIARLNGKMLGGAKIIVKKASYWAKLPTDPNPSKQHPSLQQHQRSCSQKVASGTVVAAPSCWPDRAPPTTVAASPDTVVAQAIAAAPTTSAAAAATVVSVERGDGRTDPDSDDESHDSTFSVD